MSASFVAAAAARQRPVLDELPVSGGEAVIVPIVRAPLQIVHWPLVILGDPTTYAVTMNPVLVEQRPTSVLMKGGEPPRNRTVNPQIKSLLLCQLS